MLRLAAALGALCLSLPMVAQNASSVRSQIVSPVVAGHLVVIYKPETTPAVGAAVSRVAGARLKARLTHLGMALVDVPAGQEATAKASLAAQPDVAAVLQDRMVTGLAMPIRAVTAAVARTAQAATLPTAHTQTTTAAPTGFGGIGQKILTNSIADATYRSPAGWAVRAAGGYGANAPGGPATGPWNVSRGAGVKIAILDSGVDQMHPDLAPNLALNMSEVDQAALPSACDDGSPQDQQGHGTWAASLAAGAMGLGTGGIVGVAPQATILNIKVLERMPATTGTTLAAQCEAGQTGGLMSWVLQGINDAIAQGANVISISLGSVVDLSTGDGAGWKASFDQVTYAAAQAGVVIVAAAGNDGLDLSGGQFIELPAQARDVLAVTASTNPACAENTATGATCVAGPATRPYYSNYGSTLNAISAPGGSYPAAPDAAASTGVGGWIFGACSNGLPNTQDGLPANGGSFGCFNLGHAQYVQAMGTSASAPLVAGAAAILHAAHPGWTAEQIISALRSTATASGTNADPELNLPAALELQ